VNVSAGPDMALEEFAQIGETVSQFAAADATVVIGTVLDPTLEGAVRVTLVATGIRRGPPAVEVIEGGRKEPMVKPIDYDTPTVIRRGPRAVATGGMVNAAEDSEYLDIPAFLRRQAD
jgi:cell division protein FtsZ